MSHIQISNLNPAGSDLLAGEDSFLTEIQDTEATQIHGGTLGYFFSKFSKSKKKGGSSKSSKSGKGYKGGSSKSGSKGKGGFFGSYGCKH